ncbi:MAG: SDR family NAD(P)-dependent oxidoreductase [Candidatus Peribacteria bacterium]|jgi:short-subunit dehydrogenase|nr:SDR family NAD(P)-dependent oxidoreductase [Candidatus Peribacteria bacterium]
MVNLNWNQVIMIEESKEMEKEITVITGGSSGLGLELSKCFVHATNVCIVSRDETKLNKAKTDISRSSTKTKQVLAFKADVSKEEQVKKLYEFLKGFVIKRIINCAGFGKFGPPSNINAEMVDSLIDSNLKSVIFMSSNALLAMKENGGQIVSILSSAALKGNPQETIYCAVKWGARGYNEALKAACKGTNINIITICPGGINTQFWRSDSGIFPDVSKFMNPKELANVIYSILIERKTLYCPDIVIEKL